MATFSRNDRRKGLNAVRWPLRLTWFGLIAERLWRALWPLIAVVLVVLGLLMLGVQDSLSLEGVWAIGVVSAVLTAVSLTYAFKRFRLPTRDEALVRLDATLPGRPIQALMDDQAVGQSDEASAAVWRAHQARMADRAANAQAVPADLRVAKHDPYALRFMAALIFGVALIFGSLASVGSVRDVSSGDDALASGPVWEGWAESPRYTGRPTVYLNDIEGTLELPVGSLITLRLYGEVGALTVSETVSGRTGELPPASSPEQDFTIAQEGTLAIDGPGGRSWEVVLIPDAPPNVSALEDPQSGPTGETTLPFSAEDDYGVEAGEAIVTLDLPAVDRRHGLAIDPEERPAITVALPMPFAGSRRSFDEQLIEDFSQHPWANLPVSITLSVLDASEQQAYSEPLKVSLPGRRFFDPLAASLIEQRRDLLWSRGNVMRNTQVLRALSYRPADVFRKETEQLRLKRIINRMETLASYGMTDQQQEELAQDLWDLAITIEEGDLAGALERLRRAQERLEQAMREGASPAEIAELMQELRRATDDYLRQLSQQAQRDAEENEELGGQPQSQPDQMMLSQDDIQRMMERIQELMEQGRMAEAEQALKELQELLENLQMQQAQGGQQGQSPGEQAMEGLAESLREQQGLSDEAFRDLQEQFNPGAQAGESGQNSGRNGGQGEGEQHGQGSEGSEGQEGDQPGGQQGQPQQGQNGGQGSSGEQALADRQRALRQELQRQQNGLPGAGTQEGEDAREALGRAGRAMDDAEEALRQRDFAEAIDNQSQAMDALRDAMRSLGEAMAQEQQQQQGQGQAEAGGPQGNNDPLGRPNGSLDPESDLRGFVPGQEDLYGRARDLLDEIRRRSAEGQRSEEELDYLKRLLERF
ncbi:MAG: TIGR02302 family protein [Paracoccaceae bacterium]